ncbi:MAG: radical SAM family heme chaperone HemW [bacterium]
MAERGIYVHVPFCLAKCAYCSFNSYPVPGGVPDYYVAALLQDAAVESEGWREAESKSEAAFDTVYLGGGTPSLLGAGQLAAILASLRAGLRIRPGAEITVECNPATAGQAELEAFRELGVSRLSVGVQSLAERELRVLGRLHSADQALGALDLARQAGFDDVSADVMLGIPGQTNDTIRSTLEGVSRGAGHVSAYMLSVEDGTPMAEMVSRQELVPVEDDAVADQYQLADRVLGRLGFERYEISNWSLPGRRCRHNEIYWGRGDYVGVGAGAHSHVRGVRWSKIGDPRRYAEALAVGGDAVDFREVLTRDQRLLEDVMLGLRTDRGLDLDRLASAYGVETGPLAAVAERLAGDGRVVRKGNSLTLSTKGALLHEAISTEFAAALSGPKPMRSKGRRRPCR